MFRRKQIVPKKNNTVFHEATLQGNLDMVATLLESYPHMVNQINTEGDTALSLAVKHGHNGIAELLLKNSGDATHKDRDGTTLLMIACQQDNAVLVRMLLALPIVSATEINKQGETAFSLAIENGNSYIIEALARKIKIMQLIKHGHTEIVRQILDSGCDANQSDEKNKKSLLMQAAKHGQKDILMSLLAKGADITREDDQGYTAIHYAPAEDANVCRKILKLAYVNQYFHDRSHESTYTNKISRALSFFHSHSKENKLAAADALTRIISRAITENKTIADALTESNNDLMRDHGSQLNQGRLGEIYQSLRLG